MISAFASPISDKIFMDFDTNKKHAQMQVQGQGEHSPLDQDDNDNQQLRGTVFREFTIHIFQSMHAIQQLEIDPKEISDRAINFTFTKPGFSRVIFFDLDETLAHCVRRSAGMTNPDVTLNVVTSTKNVVPVGFNIRPHTQEMLEFANRYFEVCVFTASNKEYADTILNYIDPENRLIQHRFYRESCIKADNFYIKDLRIFKNISLKDMLIVDNAVYSFGQQLDNGIPITPFKEDPQDIEF